MYQGAAARKSGCVERRHGTSRRQPTATVTPKFAAQFVAPDTANAGPRR
jgi:hypothetical protein